MFWILSYVHRIMKPWPPSIIHFALPYKVSLEFKQIFTLTINVMIFLFVVSAGLFLEIFDWRSSSKRIGLILHVSYYMFCEVFGGLSIWILYTAFWESNDESDIFRTSGEIIGIIISVFNSIQCTYFNTKIIIYYMFNGVSKLTIIPCTIPDMRL